ncbi:hypothetical protein QYE76_047658 [Lolium multiflorum]|uniref:Transposase (putative) gypsy type domain-containing protein n=1 Tax=Lolium multiflorum TaxID=4521 RepID=A0AAD8TP67_LOLMU|nr:hypothetical protein QYE76_047658 [Lolium multiflorum]
MAATDLGTAEWERSKLSAQDINLLKKLGLSKKPNALRFPHEESYPTPPMGYRLHHLTPNSILHISIFITLCEAFLGVQPNWALWKHIFFCRRNGSPSVAYNIGGVVISVRPTVDYFDVKLPDSVQGWRKKWLYIQEENNGCAEDNIRPFDGAERILSRRSWDAEATKEERTATEALMARIHELQNTRGKELSGIQITAYFLRTRVQPLQARKRPLWKYSGDTDSDRLSTDLENHPNLVSLPPLPEGGEVEERAILTDDNQDAPSFVNEPVDSRKSAGSSEKEAASEGTTSAQSPPPAVSPRNKRKRTDAEDSGTSKAEDVDPSRQKAGYDPYLGSLISSDDEEEPPTLDVAARTSSSRTLVVSETPAEGEKSSPPQLNPMVKELLRIGAQFVGYREYANKAEEKLAEANKLVDTLAQKLEQSEMAHKKADLDASQAKAEAEEAVAKVAGVEDLQKKLADAESALNDHKASQASREKAITKRLVAQNRRFVAKTNQEFELEDPDDDPLLDALSFLEFHGTEVREGMDHADAGFSKLFPYFFPRKEEPKTFLALAKEFDSSEDLGLKIRQENMKVAVESTVALVADSQQTVDWTKVGAPEQIEQTKWRSLIKAAKPNAKKILAYLGIKPASTPSSSRPELVFDNYTPSPAPPDVLPSPSCSRKNLADTEPVEDSLSQELDELRQQLQYAKRQTLVMMEQSRKASEAEKIALQQAQEAMAAKEIAHSEAEKATTRENFMLELMNEASADMSGSFTDAAAEDERVNTRTNFLVNLALDHGSLFWATPEKTRQIVRFQDRTSQTRDFLDFCTGTLSMVYNSMFPRNVQPQTLPELMERFKDPHKIHGFVKAQLVAGARFALIMLQICHSKLDLTQVVAKVHERVLLIFGCPREYFISSLVECIDVIF